MEIVAADEPIGICMACSHEQVAEPDLRDGPCQNCGEPCVKGAEEILMESF